MRKIETLKFWGAVSLLIVAIGFSSYCFAVNNQKCVARRPASPACINAGDAQCGGMPDSDCVGNDCEFCASSNILPNTFCMPMEDSNCIATGVSTCGTSIRRKGTCMRVTPDPFSPCARCGNFQSLGNCTSGESTIRVCD